MRIKLKQIAGARSGDKGKHSNVGIYFFDEPVYQWAKKTISTKSNKFSEGSYLEQGRKSCGIQGSFPPLTLFCFQRHFAIRAAFFCARGRARARALKKKKQ